MTRISDHHFDPLPDQRGGGNGNTGTRAHGANQQEDQGNNTHCVFVFQVEEQKQTEHSLHESCIKYMDYDFEFFATYSDEMRDENFFPI
jgi:hypothetical protein